MDSEIQVTGLLGPSEEALVMSSQENGRNSNEQIVNVQISTSYPNTGEQQNHYLILSGFCILLLLLVIKKRKTTD